MVSAKRLFTRVTRFSTPASLRTNVVPDGLSTRGGHTDTTDSPDLRCSLRICIDIPGGQTGVSGAHLGRKTSGQVTAPWCPSRPGSAARLRELPSGSGPGSLGLAPGTRHATASMPGTRDVQVGRE